MLKARQSWDLQSYGSPQNFVGFIYNNLLVSQGRDPRKIPLQCQEKNNHYEILKRVLHMSDLLFRIKDLQKANLK